MAGVLEHVKNLTDAELYQELRQRGFPAGPVVASTRKLYQFKLSEILEGTHGHDMQERLPQAHEMEEELTQPLRMDDNMKWSHANRSDSARSRTSLSSTPSYSSGVTAGTSGTFQSAAYYTPSKDQGRGDIMTHSSVSSSYLGTARSVGNYEDNSNTSPSWLSDSSATHPYTSTSWRTYGTPGQTQTTAFSQLTGEIPSYFPRQRTALSAAQQEMGSQYRLTGFTDGKASVFNRNNPNVKKNKSVSWILQLVVILIVVFVVAVLSYKAYDAFNENDPYQQIEQDAARLVEERKFAEKQE